MGRRGLSMDRVEVVSVFILGMIVTIIAGLVHLGVGVDDIAAAAAAADLTLIVGSVGFMAVLAVSAALHRSRGP